MQSIQTKWLALIEEALLTDCKEADVAQNTQFANTGWLYLQQGTATVVEVRYAFNDNYCELTLQGPAVDALGLTDSPPEYRTTPAYGKTPATVTWPYLKYTDGKRFDGFLDICRKAHA